MGSDERLVTGIIAQQIHPAQTAARPMTAEMACLLVTGGPQRK
ncbi:MAG TPA: hypothetical protein VMW58_03515 [Anaerolineae bacterium]|nr:hypothetical protein [Anaerolineae bacterium]